MKAILIGAGFSYECGMPLVWELTAEIRRWFAKQDLAEVNKNWKLQGGGWSDNTIAQLQRLLDAKDMHYESIIGNLEAQFLRECDVNIRQEVWGVIGFLLQAVYELLLERQVINLNYALQSLRDYDGLAKLANDNRPLCVFSLNHDLIFEMLASRLSIPIKSGFTDTTSILVKHLSSTIPINFELLPRDNIKNNTYRFFNYGEYGINLIKLHGSLDIFGFKDEVNYLKLFPVNASPESYIQQLSMINEINLQLAKQRGLYTTNECTYLDESGKIQFLRYSLLSGAHKFSKGISQVPPWEFLSLFKGNLNFADELICIGYGFGDRHIDQIFQEWLSISADKKLTIVNPGINSCPAQFNYLWPQVSCIPQGASEYFLTIEGNKGAALDQAIRAARQEARKKLMSELIGSK